MFKDPWSIHVFVASKWWTDQARGLLKELEFQRLAAELDDEHQDLRAQVGVIKVAMDEHQTGNATESVAILHFNNGMMDCDTAHYPEKKGDGSV